MIRRLVADPGRLAALLLGAALLACVASGRADLLVRPWFDVILLGTGLVVLLVAVRGMPTTSPLETMMLLLPVFVAVGVTPTLAGRISTGNQGITGLASRIGDSANGLLRGQGGKVTVLQIRLAQVKVGAVYLAGRPVTVEGRVTGVQEIGRAAIVCCAADARLVTLGVTGMLLAPKGAWVRVTGKLATAGTATVLHATKVEHIKTPSNPFM